MPERQHRVSFDLDDCLICYDPPAPCEPKRIPWPFRSWFHEPLRLGTIDLMKELVRRGLSVWIYTTSVRSPAELWWWFRFQGVRLGGVVNQDIHDRANRKLADWRWPSKYPRMFGIDLHVDDSDGVAMEGRRHGFDVVVVRPDDPDWTKKVLDAVDHKFGPTPESAPKTA